MNLKHELRDLALAVQPMAVQRLHRLGVSWPTIGQMGARHYSFGVSPVVALDDGLFALSDSGPSHLILPVYEDGELIDLCAFQSDKPHHWRLRVGAGWALGVEDGLADHYWAGRVNLFSSPLEWLRQDCDGLCVVDWTAPEVHQLRDIANINCSDAPLAAMLGKALAQPVLVPNITIMPGEYLDAA
jgi:hypothetical protein